MPFVFSNKTSTIVGKGLPLVHPRETLREGACKNEAEESRKQREGQKMATAALFARRPKGGRKREGARQLTRGERKMRKKTQQRTPTSIHYAGGPASFHFRPPNILLLLQRSTQGVMAVANLSYFAGYSSEVWWKVFSCSGGQAMPLEGFTKPFDRPSELWFNGSFNNYH